jgi:hypothetical protein
VMVLKRLWLSPKRPRGKGCQMAKIKKQSKM